jgi:2-keto-4-pentenoate hydratase
MALSTIDDSEYHDQRLNAAAMVAANVWNAGVALGAPVSGWKRVDLAQVRAMLSINGREIGSGTGGGVMAIRRMRRVACRQARPPVLSSGAA